MGGLPLHPAVVHLPLGLALALPLLTLAVALALWREWLSPRAFVLVVLVEALTVGAGFAALRTGEGDEDRVEHTAGEAAVEAHEEAAERFMIGAGVSLAVGVAGLFLLQRKRALRWIAAASIATTGVAAALAIATGHAGGKLVYGNDGTGIAASHQDDDD